MRYLITFHYRPESTTFKDEPCYNSGSFSELIEAGEFFEWWTDMNHQIVVTLFEKIGNEDYEQSLMSGH